MAEKRAMETREGYDLWSGTYDRTPNPVVALDERVLPGWIGEVEGLDVLDAGCGTGRHTGRLARVARCLVALDFSPGMIREAAGKPGAEKARFLLADLNRALPLGDARFDRVICSLVGEHLTELVTTFGEFARVLRPGGELTFSVYDPFLALSGKQANFQVGDGGVEVRLGAELHLVSDYWRAAREAGLEVTRMEQVRADEELVAEVEKAGKYLGRPLLLVLQARR